MTQDPMSNGLVPFRFGERALVIVDWALIILHFPPHDFPASA